jgi:hypothetical protein
MDMVSALLKDKTAEICPRIKEFSRNRGKGLGTGIQISEMAARPQDVRYSVCSQF